MCDILNCSISCFLSHTSPQQGCLIERTIAPSSPGIHTSIHREHYAHISGCMDLTGFISASVVQREHLDRLIDINFWKIRNFFQTSLPSAFLHLTVFHKCLHDSIESWVILFLILKECIRIDPDLPSIILSPGIDLSIHSQCECMFSSHFDISNLVWHWHSEYFPCICF